MSIEPEFTTLFRSGGAVCYSRFDLSGARSVREVEKPDIIRMFHVEGFD